MKIIDKIEIHYFRSIYHLTLSNNNDINVFVGTNDVGKSNILKALNLFFNNQTDINTEFDFLADLCRLREDEARAAKGRATIWIRVTFNNFLGWKSLPERFSIKRNWNRYSATPADSYPRGIPSVTIGRFLNKIMYHYIPAVRGRDIYAHYLSELHDSLIDDERAGVRSASNELMQAINTSTEDMSDRIRSGLGFESEIQVPEDLRDLFRALDFSTKFSGYNVPLQRRGDGVQAQHIPFILDFIARHSNRSHIWAYEEPENSLEMSRAFELAEQIDNEFSKENQIFVTTHSPAFYDLSGSKVAKWFVESLADAARKRVTSASPVLASDAADRRLGIAAIVASWSRELYEDNKRLKTAVAKLETDIADATRAQVVVEGPTDRKILNKAAELLLGGDKDFDVVAGEGAPNAASFIKTYSRLQRVENIPVLGLVDNDSAGRKEYGNFTYLKLFEQTQFRIVNKTSRFYFGVLPVPEEFSVVEAAMQSAGGDQFGLPLSIEFMFPREIIWKAIEQGVLTLEDRYADAKDGELSLKVNLTENYKTVLPEGYQYFAKVIKSECKDQFSDWVCEMDEDVFGNFRNLLDDIRQIVTLPAPAE